MKQEIHSNFQEDSLDHFESLEEHAEHELPWGDLIDNHPELEGKGLIGAIKHLIEKCKDSPEIEDVELLTGLINSTDLVGLLGAEDGQKLMDEADSTLGAVDMEQHHQNFEIEN